jgi:2,3-bisphosphoglycerate-independent phosphoglycerate mutase
MVLKHSPPTALVILDGFGYSPKKDFNAVYHAKKPNFDYLLKHYPHTLLQASGQAVGLPKGQMGNSEVGHLTIGSGRIIPQDIVRITKSIDDGSFFQNPVLLKTLNNVLKTKTSLHLMGLLSDGGVHSHEDHLFALLKAAAQNNLSDVFVHAFLDGRDVPPESAAIYLAKLDTVFREYGIGTLGTIHGRFYAMDRDNNWERTEKSYRVLTEKKPIEFKDWQQAVNHFYQHGITDEFIPPTQLDQQSIIKDRDSVIFFNFRPDRARQLTDCFVDPTFHHFERKRIKLDDFVTMTNYYDHKNYHHIEVLLKPLIIKNTLKEILERAGKTMFTIAETEKYAHVTYFFNGGKEEKLAHETRIMIPSIALKNYIECPQMSAAGITNAVVHSLKTDPKDFYLINYANADMVGHSGNFEAAVKAIEYLDKELGKLYKAIVQEQNGTLYITGDHGNAEDMFDEKTEQPKTSHTTNPVYFLMIKKGLEGTEFKQKLHGLSDIAPFILKNLGLG